MLNFDYQNKTRIVFGRDEHLRIGELVKPLASRLLVHYGSERVVENGLIGRVCDSLDGAGVAYTLLGGVIPNPDIALAREGVKRYHAFGAELILCVGGGSVIDSGKAIALGAENPGLDLWDIFECDLQTAGSSRIACVLTFPAAGSESSQSCVMSNYETNKKFGYNRPWNRPDLAVIDPTLFTTLPPYQIACGVSDMISHILERYFSNTAHTELIDGLCESTLRTLLTFGPTVVSDPRDYDAWCQVSLGGTLAHNNFLGVGREQDWGCHKLDHELSARFGVTHGEGLAVLFPAWMRYVWRVNPQRFVDFSLRVMGVEPQGSDAATIEAGICALEAFYKRIGLKSSLSALGVARADIPAMTEGVLQGPNGTIRKVGGFLVLNASDVRAIYESAL